MRLMLGVAVLLLSVACGSDAPSPTNPSPHPVAQTPPPPTPPPAPPPTIAQIGGAWNGTWELQINGVRGTGGIELTLDQSDRTVRGTWRHTSGQQAGTNPWRGEITGTLTLNEAGQTAFAGTATIVAEVSTGTGACNGSLPMVGISSAQSMRWTGDQARFTNCGGSAGGFVWIFNR